MSVSRELWLSHVESVLRSRHYTWLPEGLAGEPVDVAMTYLLTDIQHICRLADVSFEELLENSRQRFHVEEARASAELAEV